MRRLLDDDRGEPLNQHPIQFAYLTQLEQVENHFYYHLV
jgi:hypothetical protein